MKKAQTQKLQSYLQLLIMVAIVVVINIIAQFYHERLDLTTDNRYTLSETTINRLENLDDIVTVKVYLGDEDLPAGFRKLKESTRELLNEMKAYAGDMLQYQFIDPDKNKSPEQRRNTTRQLVNEGLTPINLQVNKDGSSKQKRIFPGAIFFYKNKTTAVQILQKQHGRNPHQVIHNSIMGMEYGFMNAVKKLRTNKEKIIAFVTGHGELGELATRDIRQTLSNHHEVKRINLPEYKVRALQEFDLAIIAKPTKKFSTLDKFKIDQFIMRGGKVLWLVESLMADMDSLGRSGVGMTREYNLNLRDQLFKYGVRINNDLVQDLNSHVIRISRMGRTGQRQNSFLPWPYHPRVTPKNDNPIVNNLSPIWFRFVNTIDTVGPSYIDKEVLLQTSQYSRNLPHPVRINLQNIRDRMNKRLYRAGPQDIAVLLEGTFPSVFQNRATPQTLNYGKVKNFSDSTKMIVVSDGDVIRNQYRSIRDQVIPLGKDSYTNVSFANKQFILNCIDYLLDDSGLMKLRSKEFSLRMLNKSKAEDEKYYWQVVNMGLPVILVILFGIAYNFIRRQRFAR